jgi:arylformamidase
MPIYDISRLLNPTIAVWPGDTRFQQSPTLKRSDGASVNLAKITMSSHTGTHIDAPYHFSDDGPTVDALLLDAYWGPAQVVTLPDSGDPGAPIMPADLAGVDLSLAPRLLLHTSCSHLDLSQFPRQIRWPHPELALLLQRHAVVLFGCDAPSMDELDSKALPGHRALGRRGIMILEGIDLSQVPDGVYDLVALPLKIAQGDGSPVRAALRTIS